MFKLSKWARGHTDRLAGYLLTSINMLALFNVFMSDLKEAFTIAGDADLALREALGHKHMHTHVHTDGHRNSVKST